MQYLQLVEGQRPDVLLINRCLISWDDMSSLIAHQGESRPIYAVELDGGLAAQFQAVPIGGAFRVRPPSGPTDAKMREMDRTACLESFGHGLGLCRIEEMTR